MRDITPRNSTPATPILPELSSELKRLLDAAETTEAEAIREIGSSPSLLAEVDAAMPALRVAVTEKAGKAGVKAVLMSVFSIYHQPERSQQEWADWWANYNEVLEDVPLAALEAAMKAYKAKPDSEHMPKPGLLLQLSKTTPNAAMVAYHRARGALKYAPPAVRGTLSAPEVKLRSMPTDEDRAAVRRMQDDFHARMKPPPERPDLGPGLHGKPVEGSALTPAMHDYLRRARAE